MTELDTLVKDFLSQKKIAVVGVSDKRETGCNLAYHNFKDAGYTVYPINPRLSNFESERCFPNVKSIPDKPDGVFIFANPNVTEQIVQECVDRGIKHVWMHCMMGTKAGLGEGTSSVSQKAVELCRQNGITVIAGTCPNQFLNPDFGHTLMRHLFRIMGNHRLD
jgi:predicted CoA-binding protein